MGEHVRESLCQLFSMLCGRWMDETSGRIPVAKSRHLKTMNHQSMASLMQQELSGSLHRLDIFAIRIRRFQSVYVFLRLHVSGLSV